MSDADRQWAYGPLHPIAPDCWHDRPSLWRANWREIVGTAALIAGLGCAVVMAAIAVGAA